ncbi:MAG: hypothetical protein IJN55_06710 [Alistipes sp.]|nr:hypothetical protein [Alistipes sp.]
MKNIILFLLLFVIPFGVKAQESPGKVAIYITGDINQGYKKVFGSKIVSNISSTGYVAVERTADFLSTLAREQDYQTSGVVSDSQIAKLGEQFGVHYVIAVDATVIFESIFISARMINVESAQIVASIECSGKVDSMESLMNLASEVSNSLIGELKYPGLLNVVEIRGPIYTTEQIGHLLYGNSSGYYWEKDVQRVQYAMKALAKKGQVPGSILVDCDHRIQNNNPDDPGDFYAIYKINFIRPNGSMGSEEARAHNYYNNGIRVDHGRFSTGYYYFVVPL